MRGNRYYRRHYHQSKFRTALKRIYRQLLLIAAVFAIVYLFVLRTYHAHDEALHPDIRPGDVVLVSLWRPDPVEGDIALIYPPYARRHNPFTLVRFALQGVWERLSSYERPPDYMYRAQLRRVGIDMAEPALDIPAGFLLHDAGIERDVPEDQIAVFAAGDGAYLDSSHYGPISRRAVRGVALYRIWPIERFGTLSQ